VSLQGDRLSFRVGDKALVDNISVALAAGEILAVLGPNGAGKTTLLRMLCGDRRPAQGEVMLNGRRLRNWSRREIARQRAVLPQQSSLSFPFLVRQVVEMGRSAHRRRNPRRDREIVDEAMTVADVTHLADRSFLVLSGGERQRVHLARVMAQIWDDEGYPARFLLLDEPTSALDLAHQHQVLSIAQRLVRSTNIGVLAVLHDLNLASVYADRIAVLQQGRLAALGDAASVLEPTLLSSVFGVSMHIARHPLVPGRKMIITGGADPGADFTDRADGPGLVRGAA
jgi:iron complex transport system ATP-binding protein